MRRRLALLMATMLCVTSVPQVSLIGLAAEETVPETELLESTEEAVDIGLQSDENLVGETVEAEPVETEAVEVQETLAAETEAAVTEVATEIQTEEPATEVIPEEIQSEVETTEAPQETETTVPETVSTETAMTETTAPETVVPAEIETEVPETEEVKETAEPETVAMEAAEPESEIALQSDPGYEVADLKLECSLPIYVKQEIRNFFSFNRLDFRVIYANGESQEYDLNAYTSDYYGNEISGQVCRADGTKSYSLYEAMVEMSEFETGDYYLEITCGGKTVRQNFKIFSLNELKDSATELQMGSNMVMAGYDNFYLYHFKVENDMQLMFHGDQKGKFRLFSLDESSGYASWKEYGPEDSVLGIKINGNSDYYFYSYSNSKSDVSTELTISEQPTITGIKKTNSQEEFIEGIDFFYTDKLTVELSYTNQPEQQINFDGRDRVRDSYGNTVYCEITDKDGTKYAAYGNIPAGDYVITVFDSDNREITLEIPIHIVKLEEKVTDELTVDKVTNVTLKEGQYRQWFRVTVENDGMYIFDIKTEPAVNAYIEMYDGATLEAIFEDDAGYELNAGQIYYALLNVNSGAGVNAQIGMKTAEESCEHEYVWVIDKEASCTEEGKRHEECNLCHESGKTETIPKTAHKYQLIVDKKATCGETGSQHEECTVCHTKKAATTIAATGKHNYQTIVDKAATCGAAGSQHEECSVCHNKKAATAITATGKHNYQTIVDKAATCGAAGSQHRECTVCHAKEAATAIPATGKHTYGAYKTVKAATVLEAGTEERTCTVCGNKESRSIKKLTAKISVSYKSVSVVAGSSVAGPKVTYAKGDKIASWKTSDKAVATVDKNGKITGKKAGTATITVTLKSKKSAKIKVTVKKKVAVVRVKLNKTSLTLKKGKNFQLKVTVTPKNTTDKVTYRTSNKNIVTVTSKGKLVAKKKGKATITITVGKKKATCRVTVK